MTALAGSVPVLILKEGSTRTFGRDAQRANIAAARAIAETLRTTLGPRGMDKMLVDSLGDVTITNDGATILDEMDVQHPAAKMLVEIAKAQDEEVGDGTTTVVVMAGELLKKAEELMAKNIHPTIIIDGYGKALEFCQKELEKISLPVSLRDEELLKLIAKTAMHSKVVGAVRDYLADLAVKAVRQIVEERDGKLVADVDQVQLVKRQGGSILDTKLVQGVIVDKEVVHTGMPKRVEKAKIALLDCPLEVEKTEIDAEIRISDPTQMKAFIEEEERILRGMVEKIKNVGANVVFCQKGIDDMAQHYLAKAGILAARRVKKSDMEKLARATGARIVTNIEDLTSKDLGYAEFVEERKVADEKMIFVENCQNPKSVAILIRGGLEKFVDEAERAVKDALNVVSDAIECGRYVAGGGATEMELARRLREYAAKVGGKEQLAIEAFASALESIPRALAENGGHDPIDVIMALRAEHEKEANYYIGVDVFMGKPADMLKLGVLEPLNVKLTALKSATEAASMILRIDDVIAAARSEVGKEKGIGGKEKEEEKSEE
ncbi:MAG: TCP-1/cpn60 chaperonin family protein [Candidatus Nezhaarchaeota archaeon]|nr:TCP-1/cpn60 chaperonin family protein [Candidatus Nezhaarchaeota archaeon]MCX8141910.1 TCP-1/cpn60 chaperonin family protein [Candidatus Nezhaarchaeota archaeon]MDW8050309.1 thermosome subunit beta [Nitrososphaerota archaeon]